MMLSLFTNIKGFIYGGVLIVFAAGVWYMVNQWHYAPIAHLSKLVRQQEVELKAKDLTIHNLSVQLDEMVKQNKITGFEQYWKGYHYDENITINSGSDKLVF